MNLKEQLQKDFLAAMKAKDQNRVLVLRALRGKMRDLEIEKRGELTEQEMLGVLTNAAKQRQDSIQAYREGGREDLVAQEEMELALIKNYLPEQLSDTEIEKIVDSAIAETGAETMRDIGKVMGKVMPQVKGRADGSTVQSLVRSKLS